MPIWKDGLSRGGGKMKKMSDVTQSIEFNQRLYQNQTKENEKRLKGLDPDLWETVWSRLQGAKVVWEELDSTTSLYWMSQTRDLSEHELMSGCDKADKWEGRKADFHLGVFRALCKIETPKASHRPYKALPVKPIEPVELRRRLAQVRSQLRQKGHVATAK